MPNLIFACEYGCGLGSINAFMPVADRLREAGWTLDYGLPCAAPEIEFVKRVLDLKGYDYFDVPGAPVGPSATHAELIFAGPSFSNRAVFDHDLDFWLEQIEDLRPDVVVAARAITPLIAARLAGVSSVSLDSGFFARTGEVEYPDPVESRNGSDDEQNRAARAADRRRAVEGHVLDVVNASLRRRNRDCFETFASLFSADKALYVNARMLAPPAIRNARDFVGMLPTARRGMKPAWPLADPLRPKVFAYLKLPLANTVSILTALRGYEEISAIVCVPDATDETIRRFATPHLTFCRDVLDMRAVLEEVDVVVCPGGSGLLAQALAAGKPLLLSPALIEQQLNAVSAAELGAAVVLPLNSTASVVRARLDQLLGGTFAKGRSYTACARVFMRENRWADAQALAAEFHRLPRSSHRADEPGRVAERRRYPLERFAEYDVVFLSFDEPNADSHWRALSQRVGKAIRIHGVNGFDAAHKAAAAAARTERFILVDADNLMDEQFFAVETGIPAMFRKGTWQWCSVNSVTGLSYPFGGPKVWTRTQVNGMHSHEMCDDADDPMATDFWAQPGYYTFQRAFSTNISNGSPYQAFRSAFREGAKQTGWSGLVRTPADFAQTSRMPQSRRLAVWMSVGADVGNGLWSILGARMGFLSCFDPAFNRMKISDYEWFENYWQTVFGNIMERSARTQALTGKELGVVDSERLIDAALRAGSEVRALTGNQFALDMTPDQSAQLKQTMRQRSKSIPGLFKPFGLMDGF
jgi:hypothetical protein